MAKTHFHSEAHRDLTGLSPSELQASMLQAKAGLDSLTRDGDETSQVFALYAEVARISDFIMANLARRIDELTARLEIDPSHPIDGIESRDATIRELDRMLAQRRRAPVADELIYGASEELESDPAFQSGFFAGARWAEKQHGIVGKEGASQAVAFDQERMTAALASPTYELPSGLTPAGIAQHIIQAAATSRTNNGDSDVPNPS